MDADQDPIGTVFKVGDPFPWPLPPGEGVTMALTEPGSLLQLWLWADPSPWEVKAF